MWAAGKVFGLHSGDGRILWSMSLDGPAPYTRMFVSASSHDPHHSPQVLLLGFTAQQGAYLVLDAHSGQSIDQGQLTGGLEKVGCRVILLGPIVFAPLIYLAM